ncbi:MULTISPECIES: multidrug efflux SMR transporter [Oceanobacillus]|uniref:QacE family quaternary ammonium compound efflux SMR transporter n=1 Tax=Oceanobacillus kimchii TaxID=746691 RepID=A0ABQ5TM70_9BACI|nr:MULTISPECIES: multidrug efflux SMR transporter [Oceanobacillus]MBT2599051.1 multidrug efflux SMR transporter [Oceanobacillus sp. ISL-74]MBT2651969.1 multidrug efflux SMR transporter [Oceanobacillus sp. ISL-73]MCT1578694.1 multidrug efflux SMR transporter [Oceanobacillus kimchii]MCT2136257.1 multidrug efflux SMR transporter [Oceanobacillus kimchii]OEH54331.1 transporter [Oceanobacillus sp. E9]
MHWGALIIAGVFEVFGVMSLKKVAMKQWSALLLLVLFFGISFSLLGYAMEGITMGTAYAIWTGIGTVGSTVVGMFVYGESKEWKRILCIAFIISGAIGLKLIG